MGRLYSEVDKAYAWVALFGAALMASMFAFILNGMGVMLVEYKHFFHITKTETSIISMCYMVTGPTAAFLLSGVTRRMGIRGTAAFAAFMVVLGHILIVIHPVYWMVIVGYGIIASIGNWLQYALAFTCVQLYFKRKQSIASGIVNGGMAVGILSGPICAQLLLNAFALRGTILFQAGVSMHGFLCAALFRPPKRDRKAVKGTALEMLSEKEREDIEKEVEEGKSCVKCHHMFKRYFMPYTVFLIGFFLIVMSHFYVHIYAPLRGEGMGISAEKRALLVTIAGVCGGILRPFSGWFGNFECMNNKRPILFGSGAIVNGVLIMISITFTDFTSMALFMGLYGALAGIYYGIIAAVIGDLLHPRFAEAGSGALMLVHAVAFLIKNPLTGFLMDYTGKSYSPCYVFGPTEIVGGILIVLIPWFRQLNKRHDAYDHVSFRRRSRTHSITGSVLP